MDIGTLIIGITFIIGGFLSLFFGGYTGLNEESSGLIWIILLVVGIILCFLGFIVIRSGKDVIKDEDN